MVTSDDNKSILDGFLDTVESISNLEYQRRAWICGEPPGTDFDETVNNYSIEGDGILENYKDFGVTQFQYQILRKFREQFRNFYRTHDWPPDFIDTPEWTKITEMAKELLKAFNYKKVRR